MLLWLFEHLAGFDSTFQVVRYLTLRALLSVLTALTIGLVLGPIMIRKLQALKYGQAVSSTLGGSFQSLCLDCAGCDGDFRCRWLGR